MSELIIAILSGAAGIACGAVWQARRTAKESGKSLWEVLRGGGVGEE